jgi:hypothetical protein
VIETKLREIAGLICLRGESSSKKVREGNVTLGVCGVYVSPFHQEKQTLPD